MSRKSGPATQKNQLEIDAMSVLEWNMKCPAFSGFFSVLGQQSIESTSRHNQPISLWTKSMFVMFYLCFGLIFACFSLLLLFLFYVRWEIIHQNTINNSHIHKFTVQSTCVGWIVFFFFWDRKCSACHMCNNSFFTAYHHRWDNLAFVFSSSKSTRVRCACIEISN